MVFSLVFFSNLFLHVYKFYLTPVFVAAETYLLRTGAVDCDPDDGFCVAPIRDLRGTFTFGAAFRDSKIFRFVRLFSLSAMPAFLKYSSAFTESPMASSVRASSCTIMQKQCLFRIYVFVETTLCNKMELSTRIQQATFYLHHPLVHSPPFLVVKGSTRVFQHI